MNLKQDYMKPVKCLDDKRCIYEDIGSWNRIDGGTVLLSAIPSLHETIMEKVERTRQPAVTTKDSQEETQVVFGVGTSVATEPPTDEYGNLLTTTETQSEENGE